MRDARRLSNACHQLRRGTAPAADTSCRKNSAMTARAAPSSMRPPIAAALPERLMSFIAQLTSAADGKLQNGIRAADRACELRHGVEQTIPQIFGACAVSQYGEREQAAKVLPDDNGIEARNAGLRNLANCETAGREINATELGKHFGGIAADHHKPAMTFAARSAIARGFPARGHSRKRPSKNRFPDNVCENKYLGRRKPREQRSVLLALCPIICNGHGHAVACEPGGDTASLQAPPRQYG